MEGDRSGITPSLFQGVLEDWDFGLGSSVLDPDLAALLKPGAQFRPATTSKKGSEQTSSNSSSGSCSQESMDVEVEFLWTDFSFLDTQSFDNIDVIEASMVHQDDEKLAPATSTMSSVDLLLEGAQRTFGIECAEDQVEFGSANLPVPGSNAHVEQNNWCRLFDLSLTQQQSTSQDPSIALVVDKAQDLIYRQYNTGDQPMSLLVETPSATPFMDSSSAATQVMVNANVGSNYELFLSSIATPSSPFSSRSSSRMSSLSSIDSILSSSCYWRGDHRHAQGDFAATQAASCSSPLPTRSHDHHRIPTGYPHPNIPSNGLSNTLDLPNEFFNFAPDEDVEGLRLLLDQQISPISNSVLPRSGISEVRATELEQRSGADLLICDPTHNTAFSGNLIGPLAAPNPSPSPMLTNCSNDIMNWRFFSGNHTFNGINDGFGSAVTESVLHEFPPVETPFCDSPPSHLQEGDLRLFNGCSQPPILQMTQSLSAQPVSQVLDDVRHHWPPPRTHSLQQLQHGLANPQPLHSQSKPSPQYLHPEFQNQVQQQQQYKHDIQRQPQPYFDLHRTMSLPNLSQHLSYSQQQQDHYYMPAHGAMFVPGGRQHTFSPPPISSLKRRRRLTTDESEFLLHQFGLNERPTAQDRDSFAKHLKLDRRTIQVWFQNRRAKLKRDERGGGEDESEIQEQEQEQEQEVEEIEAGLRVTGGSAVVAEASVLVEDGGVMGYGGDPLADWEYLQYACQLKLDRDLPPLPLDLRSHSLR